MKNLEERTLLIVDDSKDLREALVIEYKRFGYKIETAENGKEALQIVKAKRIDCIISDIRMPGGDGVELLMEVRKINPISPCVILISGFSDYSATEIIQKGAAALFTKPFNRKELKNAVTKALLELDKAIK